MTIPEIRKRLAAISLRLRRMAVEAGPLELMQVADEIDWLSEESRRRRFTGPRKMVSTKTTPKLRAAIRAYVAAYPTKAQAEIAKHFDVNSGRVSEALHGWRR